MDYLLHHLLRGSADRLPDQEALVDGERRLRFAEAAQLAAGLGARLREAGVERHDRVGIYLDPSLELALSIFGVSHSGGVMLSHRNIVAGAAIASPMAIRRNSD